MDVYSHRSSVYSVNSSGSQEVIVVDDNIDNGQTPYHHSFSLSGEEDEDDVPLGGGLDKQVHLEDGDQDFTSAGNTLSIPVTGLSKSAVPMVSVRPTVLTSLQAVSAPLQTLLAPLLPSTPQLVAPPFPPRESSHLSVVIPRLPGYTFASVHPPMVSPLELDATAPLQHSAPPTQVDTCSTVPDLSTVSVQPPPPQVYDPPTQVYDPPTQVYDPLPRVSGHLPRVSGHLPHVAAHLKSFVPQTGLPKRDHYLTARPPPAFNRSVAPPTMLPYPRSAPPSHPPPPSHPHPPFHPPPLVRDRKRPSRFSNVAIESGYSSFNRQQMQGGTPGTHQVGGARQDVSVRGVGGRGNGRGAGPSGNNYHYSESSKDWNAEGNVGWYDSDYDGPPHARRFRS